MGGLRSSGLAAQRQLKASGASRNANRSRWLATALEAFELLGRGCIHEHLKFRLMGPESDGAFTWEVEAADVLGEHDPALVRVEGNSEVVRPMLAQLLKIAAGAGRGHVRDCS
jgi:hypothetical protein